MTTLLQLEPLRPAGDMLEAAAILRTPAASHRLWWRFPAHLRSAYNGWADAFVVGTLFLMMEAGQPVRVEGPVSPSLLENLERFMGIWSVWGKGRYRVVDIRADHEIEAAPPSSTEVLCPFSGGADSAYTFLRHIRKDAGRLTRTIGAAVTMNGFDIWPSQKDADKIFQDLLQGIRAQLAPLAVPSIILSSNFHELPVIWAHAYGTHLISGLMLLAGRFHGTLIPNNQKYSEEPTPWGSTPLTDRYLGTLHFPIIDDAGEVSRPEKIRYVAQHSDMLSHLRVCFPADGTHKNCCACEKCIRTILGFCIADVPVPRSAFAEDITLSQIARMKFHGSRQHDMWVDLLRAVSQSKRDQQPWAQALQTAVRRGQRRLQFQKMKHPFIPLRNRIRAFFRGSTQSRLERRQGSGTPAS